MTKNFDDLGVEFKYLIVNDMDRKFGLWVNTVGFQPIPPGSPYPLKDHPSGYFFNAQKGRILHEYQIVYITKGRGLFSSETTRERQVCKGRMMFLLPGQWHTYHPYMQTGWNEYWIGFQGINVDNRVEAGFFSIEKPLMHIGYNEKIVELYIEAIRTATRQEPYFQQLLAGVVNYLLGIMFMTGSRNARQKDEEAISMVNMAKTAMFDAVEEDVTMPEIAQRLNISYTKFRRLFKEYTGLSPAQYFINLRIHRAKEMLRGTAASIKEISIILQFENPEYFATLFKKRTGITPSEFRNR